MKIYLIGMPGSGKSTLGKELASELVLPFIDLDHEIEKREGKLIKEIFSQSGEAYFRKIESEVLNTFALSADEFVLATGGGAPCFHDGIDIINKTGLSIFLDVPVSELVSRIESSEDRPLLNTNSIDQNNLIEQKLQDIRDKRLKIYSQAAITIENPTVQQILSKLKK